MSTDTIRVVVVDDHPVFRLGLAAMIQRWDDIELVGEASTSAEAIAIVEAVEPDVLIMDLHLPGGSGIEATAAVNAQCPQVAILVLTMFDDDDSVAAALRVGARGYLVKGAEPGAIERAIRGVADGDVVLGADAARQARLSWQRGADVFPELTEREREVLDLVATGLDNRSIATHLYVNEKTVRNHVSAVFTKLGASSRSEAIVKARQAGFGNGSLGSVRSD